MTRFEKQLLIIPDKPDLERDAVAAVWQSNGGQVLRLERFWEVPTVDRTQVCLYGNDTFCLVLAQLLNLGLISPPDDLLAQLANPWLKRQVQICTLAQAQNLTFAQFIKPLVPKQFRAGVYQSKEDLNKECHGLEKNTLVLVSEIVNFAAEARAFVLEDEVRTLAIYDGAGDLVKAHHFVSSFASENRLPETCVVDVGYVENRGWAVIEANSTWGAGLNGCDPLAAAVCIARATIAT